MSLVIENAGGTITVPEATLLAIAVAAAERVEGVRVLRRRSVEFEPPTVRLSLEARRGEALVELGRAVQEEVAGAYEAMCALQPRVEIRIASLT